MQSTAPAWLDDGTWRRTLDDGLRIEATAQPDSPVLGRFFAGYDRAFVLPDEKETLQGFRVCLALNLVQRHAFGRTHCELVVTLSSAEAQLVGGANFLATAHPRQGAAPHVTVALNYLYVDAASRGRGLLRKILAVVRTLAPRSVGLDGASGTLIATVFIELNDPLKMTAEHYRRDTEHSGLDQVSRLAIWSRVGARILDFPYVQPPLSSTQAPDDGLAYAALDYPGDTVPAALLHDHWQSFFGISVLKGRVPECDATAAMQLQALLQQEQPVRLLDITHSLGVLRNDFAWARRHRSLRDMIKGIRDE